MENLPTHTSDELMRLTRMVTTQEKGILLQTTFQFKICDSSDTVLYSVHCIPLGFVFIYKQGHYY